MSDNDFVNQAVARAKQVAAKLAAGADMSLQNNGSVDTASYAVPIGVKRPATEAISAPVEKRSMVNEKLSAAAEAAAKINEKLGAASAYSNPLANQTMTITHRIPDKYVGLVIGKKGEQIIQLQSDSQCKVQISQEGGLAERELTMIGTPAQIEKAKQLINDIIERAGGSVGGGGGVHSIDVMIPGMKAGLVIGKNGETIKHLQEISGAKMVLIQESNTPTGDDKPLRITGDVVCVDKAKDMVIQLLSNKDTKSYPKMPYAQPPENADLCIYAVPTEKAGLVIGKGGETIREICGRSGAFVEISKQQTTDPAFKLFNIRGQRYEIDNAIRFISERAGIPIGPPYSYYPNAQSAATTAAYSGQTWPGYAAPASSSAAAAAAVNQQGWPQASAAANAAAAAAANSSQMPAPTINPQTGQPDYSAAWAEYYRRQGMHEYADMILRQSQQGAAVGNANPAAAAGMNQMGATAQTAAAYNSAPQGQVGVAATAAQPAYDYNQWQQWHQWQQQVASQPAAQQQPMGAPQQQGAPAPTSHQPNPIQASQPIVPGVPQQWTAPQPGYGSQAR